jgi:outer membrane protein OmpA-like peptidoglycan-associated protein
MLGVLLFPLAPLAARPLAASTHPLGLVDDPEKPSVVTTEISGTSGSSIFRPVKVNGVNSPDRDNSPVVSADGSVMFFNSTRRGDREWARFNYHKNRYDEDIYYAVRDFSRTDGEYWKTPVNLGALVNSSEDDGVVAISPDGQNVYFNSLKKGWENDGGPFYSATLRGVRWSNIQGLGGGITRFFVNRDRSFGFLVYGATISPDGKDFYFATTVHSPTGHHQLWVSHLTEGAWGDPVNLGPNVNSPNGSYAPFIAADGKTLFFTSTSQSGDGSDDIFFSTLQNGIWGKPASLSSLNTEKDESFPSLPASGDRIYLSIADDDNDDIYEAILPQQYQPSKVALLSGVVADRETNTPIEATVHIEDLSTGKTVYTATSNAANGRYTALLQPGRDYGITITAPGFVFISDHYMIPASTPYQEFSRDFPMAKLQEGKSFALNNIFFQYDQAALAPESHPELDRIAELMAERPQLVIEVDGHTDNIGSSEYNRKLSLRRAEAVREYLIGMHGIAPDRITVKGYGLSRPVADNSTDGGRKQNRRTEFTVVTM